MRDWKEVELGKLGQTFSGLSGKSKDDFGTGKPYITYMNIFSNNKINPNALELVEISRTERQNKVKYGDIFFTTSSETLAEVGMTSVLLDDLEEAYLNSFCFGFRLFDFNTLLPEFATYLLRSKNVRHQIAFNGQGSTRYNLSKVQLLKNVVLKIPTKSEQITIASILTTIDQTIEKTEQLISKYERIKTGLLHDILTRGIDAHGNIRSEETHEFKDSVLGRIPKEWGVIEFEKVSEKILVGIATSSSDSFTTQEHGILFLRNQNIKSNRIDLSDVAYISKRFAHANKSKFIKEGDVLTVRTGYPGISAVVPKDLEGSQTFTTLITRLNLNLVLPQYATIWLNSDFGKFQVKNLQGGGAQQNLNAGALKKITLKKPTIDEQKMIIQRLDSLEEIIEKYNQELFKLQMSKTALMQDLLTGKVRVDALINQVAQTI